MKFYDERRALAQHNKPIIIATDPNLIPYIFVRLKRIEMVLNRDDETVTLDEFLMECT
jgi:hypothetical protein